ncbi:MAG: hypothetical protein K2O66_03110 [Bacteroidales bacterium]|nr:hypothetical protein [Bacteroidales bacterium]MDE7072341.1 hypothetical protein [Bacteroidales bacterium]
MGKNRIKPQPQIKDPVPEAELVLEFEGKKEKASEAEKKASPSPLELERRERRRKRREKIRSALDGSVFLDKGVQKYWKLVLYVFFLAMFLITANYVSETVIRKSAQVKGELKELQFRQITSRAELMRLGRQSSVADMLINTGVKESVVPPFIIVREQTTNENSGKGE